MTDRAIFNRRYSSFTADSTEVYLLNGTSVTTSVSSSLSFIAGEDLSQGEAVYVSGTVVLKASAASGVAPAVFNVVGVTSESASAASSVNVILDDTAILSSGNIIHETSLTPGQYYYLSNIPGKLTSSIPPSGITSSGGYVASAVVGLALSTSELSVEIESPVVITS